MDFEDYLVTDRNGLRFNPVVGDRYLSTGPVYKLTGVWWKAGKRIYVELMDEMTGKIQDGTWDGFVRMINEGVLVLVWV